MTLTELRDRIAKATHGSHELDVMLCDVLGVDMGGLSTSLDAAVTLVPPEAEFWRVDWGSHFKTIGKSTATIEGCANTCRAATPALALCLARIEYEIAKAGKP